MLVNILFVYNTLLIKKNIYLVKEMLKKKIKKNPKKPNNIRLYNYMYTYLYDITIRYMNKTKNGFYNYVENKIMWQVYRSHNKVLN